VGGVVVVQLRVRSVPGIFAIKVESCQKSCRNLDVFLALPNFWGTAFQKFYARYHHCIATRRLEKFHEDIPTKSRSYRGAEF